MHQQKGFTLVELMVVMAIIAILATAGISQYGKFIKGARDTTRMDDLNAINIVLIDAIQKKWVVLRDSQELSRYIREVTGKNIAEQLGNTTTACLNSNGNPVHCGYYYVSCDGGTGFLLATPFESPNNRTKYSQDDVSGITLDPDKYEIGGCNNPAGDIGSFDDTHLIPTGKTISGEAQRILP